MARISKPPEERKQEIIEAALKVFSEKGYDNTTIQDIAERLNIAQGLCYRYFKSKQEIFAATADYYAGQAVEYMTKGVEDGADAVHKFNTVLGNLFTYAIKHSEFEASYSKETQIRAERAQKMAVHISDSMIPIVRQGNQETVFHCEDIENTVRFMAFGIINLIHYDMPAENVRQHIVSYIPTIISICQDLLHTTNREIGQGWNKP